MKASFWDRVLMFLYVLLAVVLLLGVALRPLGVDIIGDLVSGLELSVGRLGCLLISYGIVAIMALLSVYMLSMIFRRGVKADRSFITVDSGDGGRVRIALSALEQMARQAIGDVEGIQDMKIHVGSDDDAISVAVDLALLSGAHVPSVTMNMRHTIRNNIEANCGVAVRAVEITVRSLVGDAQEIKPERRHARLRIRRRAAEDGAAVIVPEVPDEDEAFDVYTAPDADAAPGEAIDLPEVAETDEIPDFPEEDEPTLADDLFAVEGEIADGEDEPAKADVET